MATNDTKTTTIRSNALKSLQNGKDVNGMRYVDSSVGEKYKNFGFWLQGIDVTEQNLDLFTPYLRGWSRIFWHKVPNYMNRLWPNKTSNFKTYFETAYTAISGINDISVDFTDFEGGFAGQRFSVPQLSRDDTESFSVSMFELAGSPVREYIELWITGVRDPRSGVAHYHGLIDGLAPSVTNDAGIALTGDLSKMEYSEKNHSAEFIYCTLDPTARQCEYVAMLAHAFPTKVPKDHLNFEHGSHDQAQMDLEFRCTKYESPAINDIGNAYLACSKVEYNYLSFNPNAKDQNDAAYTTYKYGSKGMSDTVDENAYDVKKTLASANNGVITPEHAT